MEPNTCLVEVSTLHKHRNMNTKVLLLVVVQSFDVKGDSRNKAQDNFDIHNLRVKKVDLCCHWSL